MSAGRPSHQAVPIGEVSAPPFVRLPDPARLFGDRSARFAALASAGELGPYLAFLGGLAEAQHALAQHLPPPEWPAADAVDRACQYGMPPLDRSRYVFDAAALAGLAALPGLLHALAMPASAREALRRVDRATVAEQQAMVRNLLDDAIPSDAFAEHGFAAAALQVDFARRAARLDAARLVPADKVEAEGACPVCGAPPVASLLVDWPGAHGSRFCACWLCASLWHVVRIKCTLCGSTKGIAYHGVAGDAGTVKAETCEACGGYVKILHQETDPALDPMADDVASLGLDLLLREEGFRRGAFNPFLVGY